MDNDLPSAVSDGRSPLPLDHDEASSTPSSTSSHDADLPDKAALVAEIGRLAQLVGFLRIENERLAAERHDFRLRLEMQQGQNRRRPSEAKT